MSTFKVEVVKFEIEKHPNADRLSIATVRGWQAVVKTEDFQNENMGVYVPLDALASSDHPFLGFLEGKKVKAIRLRGVFSQGVLLPLKPVMQYYDSLHLQEHGVRYPEFVWHEEKDVAEILEIKKWEPRIVPGNLRGGKDKQGNAVTHSIVSAPDCFTKYTDIENYNNYKGVLEENEFVEATLKMHGTSARFAKLGGKYYIASRQRVYRTESITIQVPRFGKFLTKVLNFVGLKKLTLVDKVLPPPFTVWHDAFEKLKLNVALEKLADHYSASDVIIYGEVVNVQKGYHYGLPDGQIDFYLYDAKIVKSVNDFDNHYLSPTALDGAANVMGIKKVPVLYFGPFNEDVLKLKNGKDPVGQTHPREGIVIKPSIPRNDRKLGRVVLKIIGEEYLLDKNGSDY